jgi:plasmid stabilization system protein ParE
MERYSVTLTFAAKEDIRDLLHYLSNKLNSPQSAMELLDRIEKALESLKENPARFPLVRDERLTALGFHWLNVASYTLFFIIDEKARRIDVARVLYAKRDWARIL